ncbi:hypothetical protein AHAS_Ahas18G0161900 [Arachis hypogaea]
MEGMECFPPDSNDPLLSITATSPIGAHECGGSEMNLELTIDGQTLVDLVADPPIKSSIEDVETAMEHRLRGLIQSTEEKLRELDGRMQEMEKKATFVEGVLLQILQNTQRDKEDHHSIVMVPKPGGGPYEFESRTASHSYPCQTLTTLTQLRSSTEKGKGLEINPKGLHKSPSKESSMFELFKPDSPTDEPDVDMIDRPLWNQVESTTGLVGLYASGPSDGKPNKLAKIEQTGSTTVEGSPLTGLNLTRSGKPKRSGSRRPLLRRPGPRHHGPSGSSQQFAVPAVPMCKLATYVFAKVTDDAKCSDLLFHFAEFEISRAMFFSLIPPWTPHTDIINAWCMLASMRFSKSIAPRVWFFPSHFAVDVLGEVAIKQLQNKYEYRWMLETSQLEHVFVPVLEPVDGWYLMLLDIKALKVYVLDVCRDDESIVRRETYMTRICRTLGKLFMTERNVVNFKDGSCDPSTWKNFNYPKDIPSKLGRKEDSPQRSLVLQMRTTAYLIQSEPNQVRGLVEAKAELLWRDITANKE